METVGKIKMHHRELKFEKIKVDVIGVGAGVFDRLNEDSDEFPVVAVNAGSPPNDKERFVNLRAEMFWNLRERCELNSEGEPVMANALDLDDDEDLIAQLSSIKYKVDSHGRVKIESKEEMKKRGMKSPDEADAVAMLFAEIDEGEELYMA